MSWHDRSISRRGLFRILTGAALAESVVSCAPEKPELVVQRAIESHGPFDEAEKDLWTNFKNSWEETKKLPGGLETTASRNLTALTAILPPPGSHNEIFNNLGLFLRNARVPLVPVPDSSLRQGNKQFITSTFATVSRDGRFVLGINLGIQAVNTLSPDILAIELAGQAEDTRLVKNVEQQNPSGSAVEIYNRVTNGYPNTRENRIMATSLINAQIARAALKHAALTGESAESILKRLTDRQREAVVQFAISTQDTNSKSWKEYIQKVTN